mgnify:CR=1 FL=1
MSPPTVAVMLFWLFVAVWLLVPRTPIALKPEAEAAFRRAAELSKCDLLTLMDGEYPELQGLLGNSYAQHDGEQPEPDGQRPGADSCASANTCTSWRAAKRFSKASTAGLPASGSRRGARKTSTRAAAPSQGWISDVRLARSPDGSALSVSAPEAGDCVSVTAPGGASGSSPVIVVAPLAVAACAASGQGCYRARGDGP